MAAALLALSGLALFLLAEGSGLAAAVAVVIVAAVVLLVLPGVGARVGHANPALARWLLWTWSPAILLVAGGAVAILTSLGVVWVAGSSAPSTTKIACALVAAIVSAVGALVQDTLGGHLHPWRAKALLCARYRPKFDCRPTKAGPGLTAYKALSSACRDPDADWSGPAVEQLLRTISAAMTLEQYLGGTDYRCADPGSHTL